MRIAVPQLCAHRITEQITEMVQSCCKRDERYQVLFEGHYDWEAHCMFLQPLNI